MIIDTHCHYNLEPLLSSWSNHWQKAQEFDITNSIVVGTSLETSVVAIDLASQVPEWRASIGIHPTSPFAIENAEKLEDLMPSTQVIAIGECGLDYFRLGNESNRNQIIEQQQQSLIQQIQLAGRHHLPLIIHLRDTTETAYWDFLSIFKQYAAPNQQFILHCVSGPMAFVQQAIELGGYVGVAGNITYKNAEAIRDLVRSVPSDRVLLETDAPYLPPTPHRGQICEPWMIQLTQTFLSTELAITEETLFSNTTKLFPKLVQE